MTEKEIGLEVWKETLEVQRHFNELGMRVRSIAITVLAAVIAAAGYALKDQGRYIAGMVLLAGLVCWLAFYFIDRMWFHRLLRASVRHGEEIETDLVKSIPNIGLTLRISEGSPVWGLTAGERLSIFYALIGFLLLSVATALLAWDQRLIGLALLLGMLPLIWKYGSMVAARLRAKFGM